ncbi:MAG TPA: hypothetical protein VMD56_13835 [Steroidobacteraceae bacterium]|nr:hypothetical protein [Steroidobacteraceae bacterium]
MSSDLWVGIVGLVLLLALLPAAEHALKKLTRRHLDRRRRVIRAFLFLIGVAAWAAVSYEAWFGRSRQGWFISFLIVAGAWKLVVDVLIFGVRDPPDSTTPTG